jgi:hypothetical protein
MHRPRCHHDLETIDGVVDRAVLLRGGRLVPIDTRPARCAIAIDWPIVSPEPRLSFVGTVWLVTRKDS